MPSSARLPGILLVSSTYYDCLSICVFFRQDNVGKLVEDEYAHLVLIAALGMVDDTALLRKSVCAPLQVLRLSPWGSVTSSGPISSHQLTLNPNLKPY